MAGVPPAHPGTGRKRHGGRRQRHPQNGNGRCRSTQAVAGETQSARNEKILQNPKTQTAAENPGRLYNYMQKPGRHPSRTPIQKIQQRMLIQAAGPAGRKRWQAGRQVEPSSPAEICT